MDTGGLTDVALVGVLVGLAGTAIWLLVAFARSATKQLPIAPAIGMICVLVAGIMFFSPPSAGDPWAKFKQDHDCRVVEKVDGESTTGYGVSMRGSIGVFSGSTSPKTAYRCDDGVTYWKNE